MTDDRDATTQPFNDPGAGREQTFQTSDGLVATAFGQTDVGVQRSVNQDTLGNRIGTYADRAPEFGLLYAVADGMGGHARGEVASAMAIEQLFARYYGNPPGDDPRRTLTKVLLETNSAVYQAGRESGGASMGTTLTLLLLHDNTAFVGNIGDSRTYCIRDGQIEQLTHDHSLIGEQVRSGLLTEAQAKQSSIRNVITRAVGYRDEVVPDVFTYPIAVGDIVLLCSDGLHSMVENEELAHALSTKPLNAAVPQLIDLAKQRGGPDNITALAVRIDKLGAVAATREEATTVPFGQSLEDAVTKPMVRVEDGGQAKPAVGNDTPTAPLPIPPPPAPALAVPPSRAVPSPPPRPAAGRSSSRFPLVLLIVLPLVLLTAIGAAFVAFTGDEDPPAAGTTLATEPTSPASSTSGGAASAAPIGAQGSPVASASLSAATGVNSTIPPRGTNAPNPGATATSGAASTATAVGSTPPSVAAPATGTASSGSDPGGSGTNLLILNGTLIFRPPLSPNVAQAIPNDWEVVVYSTSAFPAGFPERPTDADLAAVPALWRGAIGPIANGGSFTYEVRGEWTLTTEQGGVLIALRNKANASIFLLPETTRFTIDSRQLPKGQNLMVSESPN